jgi:hypothetical protein
VVVTVRSADLIVVRTVIHPSALDGHGVGQGQFDPLGRRVRLAGAEGADPFAPRPEHVAVGAVAGVDARVDGHVARGRAAVGQRARHVPTGPAALLDPVDGEREGGAGFRRRRTSRPRRRLRRERLDVVARVAGRRGAVTATETEVHRRGHEEHRDRTHGEQSRSHRRSPTLRDGRAVGRRITGRQAGDELPDRTQ